MEEEKTCAIQFAVNPRFGGTTIIEDSELITKTEAIIRFQKHKERLITELQEESRPELVVWGEMKDNCDYGKELLRVDQDWSTDGVDIFKSQRETLNEDI